MPSRKSASMLSKAEIKDIRSLHDAKGRSSQQRFIAEGIKLTGEMLGAFPCELLLADEETARGIARQLDKLPQALRPKRIEVVPESFDWGRISSQRQPQPLLGVFTLPQEDEGSPIASGAASSSIASKTQGTSVRSSARRTGSASSTSTSLQAPPIPSHRRSCKLRWAHSPVSRSIA